MAQTDKMAGFFIILAGLYYVWNAFVIPIRADEAFLYLKSTGFSWHTIPATGIIEYIIKGFIYLDNSSLNLRLPSIIFISLTALLLFQFTFALAGRYGAWFSLVVFFVMPAVAYSYMSAVPSSIFIFASALYIYSIFMALSEENAHIKYYVWASISQLIIISTHYSGILFIILPFVYIIFKKNLLKNKKYMVTALLGIIWTALFLILHYAGVYEFFYKYPVSVTNKKIFIYILLFISYLPFIYVALVYAKTKKIDEKVKFLFISAVFLAVFSLFFSLQVDFDVRLTAAFMIPSIILAGYIYDVYGYKILLGVFTVVLVLTSSYTNISKTSSLTPKYMENTKIYESIRLSLQDLAYFGDSIFSYDAGLSSILAYSPFPFLEACTLNECNGNTGLFVSTNVEDNLSQYFHEVQEVNIYRAMSADKKGVTKLYFYKVSGLKIAPKQ